MLKLFDNFLRLYEIAMKLMLFDGIVGIFQWYWAHVLSLMDGFDRENRLYNTGRYIEEFAGSNSMERLEVLARSDELMTNVAMTMNQFASRRIHADQLKLKQKIHFDSTNCS